MAKVNARISLDSYVKTAKRRKPKRCETCTGCTAEMLADIKRIAELRSRGDIDLSLPQIYEEFLKPNGFKGKQSALANHIRACLGIAFGGKR